MELFNESKLTADYLVLSVGGKDEVMSTSLTKDHIPSTGAHLFSDHFNLKSIQKNNNGIYTTLDDLEKTFSPIRDLSIMEKSIFPVIEPVSRMKKANVFNKNFTGGGNSKAYGSTGKHELEFTNHSSVLKEINKICKEGSDEINPSKVLASLNSLSSVNSAWKDHLKVLNHNKNVQTQKTTYSNNLLNEVRNRKIKTKLPTRPNPPHAPQNNQNSPFIHHSHSKPSSHEPPLSYEKKIIHMQLPNVTPIPPENDAREPWWKSHPQFEVLDSLNYSKTSQDAEDRHSIANLRPSSLYMSTRQRISRHTPRKGTETSISSPNFIAKPGSHVLAPPHLPQSARIVNSVVSGRLAVMTSLLEATEGIIPGFEADSVDNDKEPEAEAERKQKRSPQKVAFDRVGLACMVEGVNGEGDFDEMINQDIQNFGDILSLGELMLNSPQKRLSQKVFVTSHGTSLVGDAIKKEQLRQKENKSVEYLSQICSAPKYEYIQSKRQSSPCRDQFCVVKDLQKMYVEESTRNSLRPDRLNMLKERISIAAAHQDADLVKKLSAQGRTLAEKSIKEMETLLSASVIVHLTNEHSEATILELTDRLQQRKQILSAFEEFLAKVNRSLKTSPIRFTSFQKISILIDGKIQEILKLVIHKEHFPEAAGKEEANELETSRAVNELQSVVSKEINFLSKLTDASRKAAKLTNDLSWELLRSDEPITNALMSPSVLIQNQNSRVVDKKTGENLKDSMPVCQTVMQVCEQLELGSRLIDRVMQWTEGIQAEFLMPIAMNVSRINARVLSGNGEGANASEGKGGMRPDSSKKLNKKSKGGKNRRQPEIEDKEEVATGGKISELGRNSVNSESKSKNERLSQTASSSEETSHYDSEDEIREGQVLVGDMRVLKQINAALDLKEALRNGHISSPKAEYLTPSAKLEKKKKRALRKLQIKEKILESERMAALAEMNNRTSLQRLQEIRRSKMIARLALLKVKRKLKFTLDFLSRKAISEAFVSPPASPIHKSLSLHSSPTAKYSSPNTKFSLPNLKNTSHTQALHDFSTITPAPASPSHANDSMSTARRSVQTSIPALKSRRSSSKTKLKEPTLNKPLRLYHSIGGFLTSKHDGEVNEIVRSASPEPVKHLNIKHQSIKKLNTPSQPSKQEGNNKVEHFRSLAKNSRFRVLPISLVNSPHTHSKTNSLFSSPPISPSSPSRRSIRLSLAEIQENPDFASPVMNDDEVQPNIFHQVVGEVGRSASSIADDHLEDAYYRIDSTDVVSSPDNSSGSSSRFSLVHYSPHGDTEYIQNVIHQPRSFPVNKQDRRFQRELHNVKVRKLLDGMQEDIRVHSKDTAKVEKMLKDAEALLIAGEELSKPSESNALLIEGQQLHSSATSGFEVSNNTSQKIASKASTANSVIDETDQKVVQSVDNVINNTDESGSASVFTSSSTDSEYGPQSRGEDGGRLNLVTRFIKNAKKVAKRRKKQENKIKKREQEQLVKKKQVELLSSRLAPGASSVVNTNISLSAGSSVLEDETVFEPDPPHNQFNTNEMAIQNLHESNPKATPNLFPHQTQTLTSPKSCVDTEGSAVSIVIHTVEVEKQNRIPEAKMALDPVQQMKDVIGNAPSLQAKQQPGYTRSLSISNSSRSSKVLAWLTNHAHETANTRRKYVMKHVMGEARLQGLGDTLAAVIKSRNREASMSVRASVLSQGNTNLSESVLRHAVDVDDLAECYRAEFEGSPTVAAVLAHVDSVETMCKEGSSKRLLAASKLARAYSDSAFYYRNLMLPFDKLTHSEQLKIEKRLEEERRDIVRLRTLCEFAAELKSWVGMCNKNLTYASIMASRFQEQKKLVPSLEIELKRMCVHALDEERNRQKELLMRRRRAAMEEIVTMNDDLRRKIELRESLKLQDSIIQLKIDIALNEINTTDATKRLAQLSYKHKELLKNLESCKQLSDEVNVAAEYDSVTLDLIPVDMSSMLDNLCEFNERQHVKITKKIENSLKRMDSHPHGSALAHIKNSIYDSQPNFHQNAPFETPMQLQKAMSEDYWRERGILMSFDSIETAYLLDRLRDSSKATVAKTRPPYGSNSMGKAVSTVADVESMIKYLKSPPKSFELVTKWISKILNNVQADVVQSKSLGFDYISVQPVHVDIPSLFHLPMGDFNTLKEITQLNSEILNDNHERQTVYNTLWNDVMPSGASPNLTGGFRDSVDLSIEALKIAGTQEVRRANKLMKLIECNRFSGSFCGRNVTVNPNRVISTINGILIMLKVGMSALQNLIAIDNIAAVLTTLPQSWNSSSPGKNNNDLSFTIDNKISTPPKSGFLSPKTAHSNNSKDTRIPSDPRHVRDALISLISDGCSSKLRSTAAGLTRCIPFFELQAETLIPLAGALLIWIEQDLRFSETVTSYCAITVNRLQTNIATLHARKILLLVGKHYELSNGSVKRNLQLQKAYQTILHRHNFSLQNLYHKNAIFRGCRQAQWDSLHRLSDPNAFLTAAVMESLRASHFTRIFNPSKAVVSGLKTSSIREDLRQGLITIGSFLCLRWHVNLMQLSRGLKKRIRCNTIEAMILVDILINKQLGDKNAADLKAMDAECDEEIVTLCDAMGIDKYSLNNRDDITFNKNLDHFNKIVKWKIEVDKIHPFHQMIAHICLMRRLKLKQITSMSSKPHFIHEKDNVENCESMDSVIRENKSSELVYNESKFYSKSYIVDYLHDIQSISHILQQSPSMKSKVYLSNRLSNAFSSSSASSPLSIPVHDKHNFFPNNSNRDINDNSDRYASDLEVLLHATAQEELPLSPPPPPLNSTNRSVSFNLAKASPSPQRLLPPAPRHNYNNSNLDNIDSANQSFSPAVKVVRSPSDDDSNIMNRNPFSDVLSNFEITLGRFSTAHPRLSSRFLYSKTANQQQELNAKDISRSTPIRQTSEPYNVLRPTSVRANLDVKLRFLETFNQLPSFYESNYDFMSNSSDFLIEHLRSNRHGLDALDIEHQSGCQSPSFTESSIATSKKHLNVNPNVDIDHGNSHLRHMTRSVSVCGGFCLPDEIVQVDVLEKEALNNELREFLAGLDDRIQAWRESHRSFRIQRGNISHRPDCKGDESCDCMLNCNSDDGDMNSQSSKHEAFSRRLSPSSSKQRLDVAVSESSRLEGIASFRFRHEDKDISLVNSAIHKVEKASLVGQMEALNLLGSRRHFLSSASPASSPLAQRSPSHSTRSNSPIASGSFAAISKLVVSPNNRLNESLRIKKGSPSHQGLLHKPYRQFYGSNQQDMNFLQIKSPSPQLKDALQTGAWLDLQNRSVQLTKGKKPRVARGRPAKIDLSPPDLSRFSSSGKGFSPTIPSRNNNNNSFGLEKSLSVSQSLPQLIESSPSGMFQTADGFGITKHRMRTLLDSLPNFKLDSQGDLEFRLTPKNGLSPDFHVGGGDVRQPRVGSRKFVSSTPLPSTFASAKTNTFRRARFPTRRVIPTSKVYKLVVNQKGGKGYKERPQGHLPSQLRAGKSRLFVMRMQNFNFGLNLPIIIKGIVSAVVGNKDEQVGNKELLLVSLLRLPKLLTKILAHQFATLHLDRKPTSDGNAIKKESKCNENDKVLYNSCSAEQELFNDEETDFGDVKKAQITAAKWTEKDNTSLDQFLAHVARRIKRYRAKRSSLFYQQRFVENQLLEVKQRRRRRLDRYLSDPIKQAINDIRKQTERKEKLKKKQELIACLNPPPPWMKYDTKQQGPPSTLIQIVASETDKIVHAIISNKDNHDNSVKASTETNVLENDICSEQVNATASLVPLIQTTSIFANDINSPKLERSKQQAQSKVEQPSLIHNFHLLASSPSPEVIEHSLRTAQPVSTHRLPSSHLLPLRPHTSPSPQSFSTMSRLPRHPPSPTNSPRKTLASTQQSPPSVPPHSDVCASSSNHFATHRGSPPLVLLPCKRLPLYNAAANISLSSAIDLTFPITSPPRAPSWKASQKLRVTFHSEQTLPLDPPTSVLANVRSSTDTILAIKRQTSFPTVAAPPHSPCMQRILLVDGAAATNTVPLSKPNSRSTPYRGPDCSSPRPALSLAERCLHLCLQMENNDQSSPTDVAEEDSYNKPIVFRSPVDDTLKEHLPPGRPHLCKNRIVQNSKNVHDEKNVDRDDNKNFFQRKKTPIMQVNEPPSISRPPRVMTPAFSLLRKQRRLMEASVVVQTYFASNVNKE